MAESVPELEVIAKRDFRTVTKTGNELIKTITTTAESPDHDMIIKEGLEAAIREYISIVVEKSNLSDLSLEDEKYKFLSSLDVKSIFEPNTVKQPPLMEKTQHLVEQMAKDQKQALKKLEVMDQLDKTVKKLEKKATREQVKDLKKYAEPAVDFVKAYKEKLLR